MLEKRGALTGAAVSEEVLASSATVLASSRAGTSRGLQQFWAPPEAARFVAEALGSGNRDVLDPTAGAGALLSGFKADARWGIEIDADQIHGARGTPQTYEGLKGDIQHILPLLMQAGCAWPAVVCNPPFGLAWDVPGLGKGSSTELGFRIAQSLCMQVGDVVFVAGRDRFYREVHPMAEAGFYAILEIGRLFPGVDLPCVIAFWTGARIIDTDTSPVRESLPDTGNLTEHLARRVQSVRVRRHGFPYARVSDRDDLKHRWSVVGTEYTRLLGERIGVQEHTVELRGGKLSVRPSAFTKIALAEAQGVHQVRWLESFDKQTPAYFAIQTKEWAAVKALEGTCGLTIAPQARTSVEAAILRGARQAVPLYEVAPAQRLGFLTDCDKIVCARSDAERGFDKGQEYDISCSTAVLASKEQREKQTVEGPVVQDVLVERKAMRIRIGQHQFTEGSDDLAYLMEHFDVPDPGEIASRFPAEVKYWEGILGRVEQEIQSRVPGFRFRTFQAKDIARLLFKGGGILGWEQGLGKCVHGDTLLGINDTLRTMEATWAEYADPASVVLDREGGEWASPRLPLFVAGLDAGGIEKHDVSRLYRQHVHERLRRILLDDGSEVITTKVHKFYDGTAWRNNIQAGDILCVPSRLPHGSTPVDLDLVRLLTWQVAEGCETGEPGQFSITQYNRAVLDAWREDARTFGYREGVEFNNLPLSDDQTEIRGFSVQWMRWLKNRDYRWGQKSAGKSLPDFLMQGNYSTAREILRVYFEAEGCPLASGMIEVSSASKLLIEQIRVLLRRFGVWSRMKQIHRRLNSGERRRYWKLTFGGADARIFRDNIGFAGTEKQTLLSRFTAKKENSNWRGVPIEDVIKTASKKTGLARKALGWRGTTFHGNYSRNGLQFVIDRLQAILDGSYLQMLRLKPRKPFDGKRDAQIARLMAAPTQPIRDALQEIVRRCTQEVHYAHVKEIEFFDFDGYVYDVEVPCPHNFVANGMLAHNTAGEGMFVRALELSGRLPDGCALFVVPQDLARQTQEEFHRFFGRDLWLVSHLGCASGKERKPKGERYISAVQLREMVRARRRDLAMQRQGFSLAPRPPVWAATWFEALARTDRMDEILPVETVRRMKIETAPAQPERRANWYSHEMLPATPAEYEWRTFTSADICPSCGSSRVQDAQADHGWNGTICRAEIPEDKRTPKHRICGYVHRKLLRKPAYSILAGLFKVVVVDEGTKIKGDDSLASKAVRALRGEYRLLMTGTPMKNFVVDLYWLLWWALGDGSPRFPYSYRGGRQRFTDDFAVVETRLNEWGHKERGAQPKVLPEVSNLLRLWKMLCSSLVRRRMDDVGCVVSHEGDWTCPACKASNRAEVQGQAGWSKPDRLTCPYCDTVWDSLAPLTYIPVSVPWGAAQRMFYSKWLDKQNFARHFLAKHPSSPLAEHPDVIPILAASLGQLAKLEYATTDPMGDPDPDYRDSVAGLSRWTPNRLKVLQLAVEHARAGEKVLVGSSLVAPGPWIAERLCERNVRAVHICEEDAEGCVTTKAPAKRADAVADFRQGRADVLCVGVNAMCLGHNLDVASVVIVDGLPWDFATWDQFVKRARRLTSKRPVKVYVMLPADSLATKKWSLLKDKTASADLALDGRLARQDERPVDRAAVLRELQDRGVRFDGTEVPEAQVQRMWADALATERPVLPVPVASHRMSVVDAQGRTSYWPAPATSPAQAPASPANGHANAADARNGQAPRVCIRRGKARVYGEREGDVYVCTGTRGRMSVLYPPGREGDPESAVLVETKDVASARDIGLLFAV